MNIPSIYESLTKNSLVQDILSWPFDFEVCKPYLLSSDWPISLSEELIVLAEDGCGGVFTILENIEADLSPVIFLSSEGQAGKVSENFVEFLSVMVAIPYWRDLLKFSAGGELEEMKKAIPFLEAELLEDEPDILNKKKAVFKELQLRELSEPVQTLFSSVKSGLSIEIKASDGTPYDSLFNTLDLLRKYKNSL